MFGLFCFICHTALLGQVLWVIIAADSMLPTLLSIGDVMFYVSNMHCLLLSVRYKVSTFQHQLAVVRFFLFLCDHDNS